MTSDRIKRLRQTTCLHHAMESEEMLRKIESFPDPPESMHFFYELFHKMSQPGAQHNWNEKIIGTLCVQVPDELIYAMGARPIRLCSGVRAHESAGAEFMPARSCPVIKATLGMFESTMLSQNKNLLGIVVPATCDQKRKAAEILAGKHVPVHLLEMPPAKESENSRLYWQESIKEFTQILQSWTGNRLKRKNLAQAIIDSNKASRSFRRLFSLQRSTPAPLRGNDMLLIANSYFFSDRNQWQKAVTTLSDELEIRIKKQNGAAPKKAPRILLTGSPAIFPNLKVPLLIEEAGAIIVTDELCSSNRLLYDQPILGEGALYDMLPALADRYLKPCTCPCLAGNSDRQRKILTLAKEYNVDGIIYQAFSGCLPYELEQRQISTVLAEKQLPMLYVETDYSPEDIGQLTTRVEAFLESIKARKRKLLAA